MPPVAKNTPHWYITHNFYSSFRVFGMHDIPRCRLSLLQS